jgi:hypothetical protein
MRVTLHDVSQTAVSGTVPVHGLIYVSPHIKVSVIRMTRYMM